MRLFAAVVGMVVAPAAAHAAGFAAIALPDTTTVTLVFAGLGLIAGARRARVD